MAKDEEIVERKPMSLVEARKRVNELKLMARMEGKRSGQAVASPRQRTPDERKGKR